MTQLFPNTRLRRKRVADWSIQLFAENNLLPQHLVLPLILTHKAEDEPIPSMPGICRYSIKSLCRVAKEAYSLGIKAIILFPHVDNALKTEKGEEAYNPETIIVHAIKELKNAVPEIGIISDVALDPYTTHGHDGVLNAQGYVDNDVTVEALVKQALNLARAGCDIVAPSDMMDGRIKAIRESLELEGFHTTQLMAYSAKYSSQFYGPYRTAIGSSFDIKGSNKNTYHQCPANGKEALVEVEMDIAEGADSVIIKPGMPYLDVIHSVATNFNIPVLAFQVSGEYTMLKLASDHGILNFHKAMMETLICFRRAQAQAIITYAALEMAKLLPH